MLIICDFDGTVTARDTNSSLAQRFAPAAFAQVEGRLASRELTLREVLDAEFRDMRVGLDAVLDEARRIPLRDGFLALLDAVRIGGHHMVLLSSGFREIIEPILEHHRLAERVPLVANSITFSEDGGSIQWRDLPICELCGEQCKRHDVERLRAEYVADGGEDCVVVFVGDGMSDRCGAEAADLVLARDALARYLSERSMPYGQWSDFNDVVRLLGISVPEVIV